MLEKTSVHYLGPLINVSQDFFSTGYRDNFINIKDLDSIISTVQTEPLFIRITNHIHIEFTCTYARLQVHLCRHISSIVPPTVTLIILRPGERVPGYDSI